MLGDFLTRCFILVFGYAYPAFECYKTLEKNKVNMEELRFWCQYWIIAATITTFERFGDIFVSWIPMYGEAKLFLFIYLWFPKTQGCRHIYQIVVRPYIAKHETYIDRSILELRARGMDLVIYYSQNFAKMGQTKFFEILQHFASHSANMAIPKAQNADIQVDASVAPSPAPPSSPSSATSEVKKRIRMLSENNRQLSDNNRQFPRKVVRPPFPPVSPTSTPTSTPTATTTPHGVARLASAKTFQVRTEKETTRFAEGNGVDHDSSSPTLAKLRRAKTTLQQK